MKSSGQNERLLELIIGDDQQGQRLDHALAELSGFSRSRVQQLLQEGCVQGQGQAIKASLKVARGERYTLQIPDTQPMRLEAEQIELDILFEDEHLLVINKPAGMVVHPSHGHGSGTLVHALLHHCPDLPGINGVERPGIVHRLDKGTSGSLVVAKTERVHHALIHLFSEHRIERQYLAWCRGVPNWRQKRIDHPIGRHPQHRQKMAIVAYGKPAVTDARIEQTFGTAFCRARLTLHTGRTHQIRVHLAHEHLPILGDATYARRFNPGKQTPEMVCMAIQALSRQALHAEVLGFTHPVTQQRLRCLAPLPDDLRALDTALNHAYD